MAQKIGCILAAGMVVMSYDIENHALAWLVFGGGCMAAILAIAFTARECLQNSITE